MRPALISIALVVCGVAATVSWEKHVYRSLLGEAEAANQCPSWSGLDYYIVADSGPCLPYSVFDTDHWSVTIDHVPYPHSSFHFTFGKPLFPNGGVSPTSPSLVSPEGTKYPRVAVVTSSSKVADSDNVFHVLSPEVDYNWPDFQANRDAYVWTQLQPSNFTPGVYKVDLDAWDYLHDSGTCSLCFSLSDHYRPQSTNVCPDSALFNLTQTGWSSNVAYLTNYLALVENFTTSRTNNDCSTRPPTSCPDTTLLTGTDWFQCPLNISNATSPAAAFKINAGTCVTTKLTSNPFATDDVLANPASFLTPSQCTRSVSFDYKWYEYWVAFSCSGPSVSRCSSGADGADGGDATGAAKDAFECAATVSLAATADDLVKSVQVVQNASLVNHSQYITDPNGTFPDMNYSHVNQLHFWSPAVVKSVLTWDEFAPITFNIQDLLTTAVTGGGIAHLTDLSCCGHGVFWRWKQDNGPYKDYAANDQLNLTKLATEITFEAWTHCGVKTQNIVWTVYNHRHQTIKNLDEWFATSWSFDGDANCNIRQSDFTALRLHFDLSKLHGQVVDAADVGNGTTALLAAEMPSPVVLLDESDQVRWIFNDMKCTWKYGEKLTTDYSPSVNAWTLHSTDLVNGALDATFAPKLLNDATTFLTILCDLSFADTLSLTGLAVLYTGDFKGPSQAFGFGTYNLDAPFRHAVGSIKVKAGYEVVLYDGRDGQGNSTIVRTDTPALGLDDWGRAVSSIKVRECTLVVLLYAESLYAGAATPLGVGDNNLLNTNFSSFQMLPGYQITLYDDYNQEGKSITLSTSTTWLGALDWYGALSVRVESIGDTVATLWGGAFTGASTSFDAGHYNLQRPLLNNVTSITIAPGYEITLFDQLNQRGNSIKFVQNEILSDPWITTAKSIAIEPIPNSLAAKTTNIAHVFESTTFWFQNCDILTWGSDGIYENEECVNSCAVDSWKLFVDRVAGPFQACAGNLIYPDSDWSPDSVDPLSTVLDVSANHSCCTACNGQNGFKNSQTAVCTPANATAGISRCQPSQYDLVAEAAAERATPSNPGPGWSFVQVNVNSTVVSSIVMLLALVFVGVVHKSLANRQMSNDDHVYMSLTDIAL
ncbi:unnamed protein product [Aphanomyces euteiches]|uniref:Uncharacterized protein n=1 Tax=Aphanomyces euteiches TaxID=100861 RepID=A0A6G0X6X4_9STRA|nr:hypothetical protein Ae201684_007952 [Aphanomyces euteiches]KAH9074669.1 hypothetical protein Ae201684P_022471 [Aphanomyces euteiches]